MSEKEFHFSKYGHRKMNAFTAKGLLFDYVTNQLDSERRTSLEECLQQSEESQRQLQKIERGLELSEAFSQIQVSEELVHRIALSSSYFYTVKEKLNIERWSPALKLGLEGSFIALGVALLAIVIPWNSILDINIGPQHVVLSEVTKTGPTANNSELATGEKEGMTFPDDVNIAKSSLPDTSQTLPNTPELAQLRPSVGDTAQGVSPPLKASSSPTPAAPPKPEAKVVAQVQKNEVPTSDKRAGFLFRGDVYVTNVKAITPKLVEKVEELGGRKAGQVALGWFKGDSSYFHFTIPESRYQELEAYFGTYGELKIQRESHERVMPEGIRRVIITVYEKK